MPVRFLLINGSTYIVLLLVFSLRLAAQPPAHCAQVIFCLLNQEAEASDSIGITNYSNNLIELIVPPDVGKPYIVTLANRLAVAEKLARSDKRKLIDEGQVAHAYNEMIKNVGGQSSLSTDAESLHRFRQHAASIKAFPSLLTAGRNGSDCNPGEAVFLLYLLISGNGTLYDKNLDSALALMNSSNSEKGAVSFGVTHMENLGTNATNFILAYVSHHNRAMSIALFNNLSAILGF